MEYASVQPSLMPPMIGGRRDEVGNPGNVAPTLYSPLADANAPPGTPGPSLSYHHTQYGNTFNVAVDARAVTMEVTEIRQQAERRHQLALQQMEA